MRKPGTDETNVQMSDVICDFCRREWVDDLPMLEGHQGSCICGRCLSVAYAQVVLEGESSAPPPPPAEYTCPMCLEASADRAALGRADEPAWQSPSHPESVLCRRCIELAANALEKDKDWNWHKPTRAG